MAHPGRPLKSAPEVDNLRSDIVNGKYDTAKQTLKTFGIDAADGDGRTALIIAVIENKLDFIKWLVDNGANLNHQDRAGYSALHFAGQEKLVEVSRFLLVSGANPNVQDIHGNTPLWTAIINAKLPTDEQGVVRLLLKHGANPDLVNKHGKTARFMYATFHGKDILSVDVEL
jgi:ankyrin repeat protein